LAALFYETGGKTIVFAREMSDNASTFSLHDNGGRPFRVEVGDGIAKIYKQTDNSDDNIYIYHSQYSFQKAFIGKDSLIIAQREEEYFNEHPENFFNPNHYTR
jgi:hypothetical protein